MQLYGHEMNKKINDPEEKICTIKKGKKVKHINSFIENNVSSRFNIIPMNLKCSLYIAVRFGCKSYTSCQKGKSTPHY